MRVQGLTKQQMEETRTVTKDVIRVELEKAGVVLSNNAFKATRRADLIAMLFEAVEAREEETVVINEVVVEETTEEPKAVAMEFNYRDAVRFVRYYEDKVHADKEVEVFLVVQGNRYKYVYKDLKKAFAFCRKCITTNPKLIGFLIAQGREIIGAGSDADREDRFRREFAKLSRRPW